MIGKVDFFWEEEALLHADTKVRNPFDFFTFLTIADSKLRYPNTVDKSLGIFHDVVKNQVQKDK